ncbi:hypothetical protein ACKWTF_006744 [Chironomus riparius]
MLSNNRCIAECRKFSPNIFNKNKCTGCFGKREEHNAAALDHNRASRKVSKCGYLFVAPQDWDWNNPLYRTKRWQRRWFILFDDGELTYSVDDHLETVPQASINMSDVIEVADAEQITGHCHSILIQTPDLSTFVKGTCQEESKWWYNILVQFVKSKVRHHKRNTFLKGQNQKFYNEAGKSPPTRDKLQPESKAQVRSGRGNRETDATDSPSLFYEDVIRDEKLKDIANKITNITSSSTTAQEIDRKNRWTMSDTQIIIDETPTRDDVNKQKRPQSLSIISTAPSIISVVKKKSAPPEIINYQKTSHSHERGDPDGDCGMEDSPTNYCNKATELRVKLPSEEILHSKSGWLWMEDHQCEWCKYWFSLKGGGLFYYRDPSAEERGVLDGILDVNSITSIKEITTSRSHAFQLTTWDNKRLNLSSVTSNVKNNWINALRNASGLVDNAINQTLDETNNNNKNNITKSNNEISTTTGTTVVSAVNNRNLKKLEMPSYQDENGISLEKKAKHSLSLSSPLTPCTSGSSRPILFSSDEEYKTASEGGRRESIDWGSPLSPSNPIQITIQSHAKESKIRSNLRNNLHKRSLSSPPTSRRSTIDSNDDFVAISTVREEERTANIENEFNVRLMASEKKLSMMHDEARERDIRMAELLETLEKTEMELAARRKENEEMKEKLLKELMENRESAKKIINKLTDELVESQNKMSEIENQLQRGIEENDSLYQKIRSLESSVVPSSSSTTSLINANKSSGDRIRRMDSFSDLTCLNNVDPDELDKESLVSEYQELKQRFEKVVNELKMMKRELRESYNSYDNLDLAHTSLRQDLERKHNEFQMRNRMMADRIQDLTNKYSAAEKQVRILKQKLMKSERKRTSSLKGKETLQVQKELEDKVMELEGRFEINHDVEMPSPNCSLRASPARCETPEKQRSTKLRRKSLDSVSSQPMQLLVRLNALEKRFENNSNLSLSAQSSSSADSSHHHHNNNHKYDHNSHNKTIEEMRENLRNLENVVASSRNIMDESLQLIHHYNKSLRSRCSETLKVEQLLVESVKILNECQHRDHSMSLIETTSTGDEIIQETGSVKLALLQLESQLKAKLSELLKQRRILRETNKLSHKKDLELLAERLAFESVCFGKLRDSLSRADQLDKFVEHQTKCEIVETTQLMALLKAKLCGKTSSIKNTGSLDVLAQVLARRLLLTASKLGQMNELITSTSFTSTSSAADLNFVEDLLRQQNELHLITKRYKINTIENLAYDLAAETLNYISANNAVQGAVQEAWRYAQETVNSELIQYEISHIMQKTAKRYENSLTSSFGYTLTSQERISFEVFADAVQDSLRKEMESTISQLTQCYEENLTKMKQGQWRLHLEQEHKASEGRQLLIEFADIIAQKALIDARISIIRGDTVNANLLVEPDISNEKEKKSLYSLSTMQKYENLFVELSEDMDISNTDDILAEADFNFMFKNFAFACSVNKQEMNDLSNVIIKLEEVLLQVNNKMNPNLNINHIQNLNLDNIKNISTKLNEFYQTAEKISFAVDKILTSPCQDCDKIHETLLELTNQHDEEIDNMKRKHSEMLLTLNEQIDEQATLVKQLRYELSHMENMCLEKTTHGNELMQQLNDREEKIDELTQRLYDDKEKINEMERNYEHLYEQFTREQEINKKFENKIDLMELENSDKIQQLQQYYQEQLKSEEQSERDRSGDEEDLHQKYQAEIEQLRTLCEKGLVAIESSHKRKIADLEAKHKSEIQRLFVEKEQALAEETQATLQALESMRKAHQNEVEREVNRFKQEFLHKFNNDNREQLESLAAVKTEKELDEVRQEILSLSEKYSLKCVEAISLEEKLRNVQQKFRHAQQIIQSYEMMSKNPKSHQESFSSLNLRLDDNLPHESINLKNHESLPTSPTSVPRDESKESILNLPLIPFKLKAEKKHQRTKLNDGNLLQLFSLFYDKALLLLILY